MLESRLAICFGVLLLTAACDSNDTGGEYPGVYEVPVPSELAAAASYPVESVEWEVRDGIASLKYDLPRALVGRQLRVEMEGPIDEEAGTASLSGEVGTATCEIDGGSIECLEQMPGLQPVEPDYAIIEELAQDYDGPAADRIAVAERFAGDPIGIVKLNLDGATK